MTQSSALSILKLGKNVFLTGAPGAGKTYLLNQYIDFLRSQDVNVAVTAYTGIAASHLNGRTLHSWATIPRTPVESEEHERQRVRGNERLVARLRKVRVLVIDEISMLHPEEFERVDLICRTARNSFEPFGGLQLICCGDFFQIPPVNQLNDQFVIDCPAWKNAGMEVCYIEEQHRQGDQALLDVLGEIRSGHITPKTIQLLRERKGIAIKSKTGVANLYTHRDDVQEINNEELKKLKGDLYIYDVNERGDKRDAEKMRREYEIGKLSLKVGAHVMFTRNNPSRGYVNGTLGKVVAFENGESEALPVVETFDHRRIAAAREDWQIAENETSITISQIPLKLAWAITIHKSQGMTLDAAVIDLGRAFARGMGYVALSRVRKLENISLVDFNEVALMVSERIKGLDKDFLAASRKAEKELSEMSPEEQGRVREEFIESASKDEWGDPHGLRLEYGEGVDV